MHASIDRRLPLTPPRVPADATPSRLVRVGRRACRAAAASRITVPRAGGRGSSAANPARRFRRPHRRLLRGVRGWAPRRRAHAPARSTRLALELALTRSTERLRSRYDHLSRGLGAPPCATRRRRDAPRPPATPTVRLRARPPRGGCPPRARPPRRLVRRGAADGARRRCNARGRAPPICAPRAPPRSSLLWRRCGARHVVALAHEPPHRPRDGQRGRPGKGPRRARALDILLRRAALFGCFGTLRALRRTRRRDAVASSGWLARVPSAFPSRSNPKIEGEAEEREPAPAPPPETVASAMFATSSASSPPPWPSPSPPRPRADAGGARTCWVFARSALMARASSARRIFIFRDVRRARPLRVAASSCGAPCEASAHRGHPSWPTRGSVAIGARSRDVLG